MAEKLEIPIPVRLSLPDKRKFEDCTNPERSIALDREVNAFSFWLSENGQAPLNSTERSITKNYLMWKMTVDAPVGSVPDPEGSKDGEKASS